MPTRFFHKASPSQKKDLKVKHVFAWQKVLITVTIITIIVIEAFLLGVVKKSCDNDECFKTALNKCSTAKYLQLQNYNYYKWNINGKDNGNCDVDIMLVKMASGTPVDKVTLFEGKEMACKIPLSVLEKKDNTQIENVLNYCTGPLKEATYQSIIERLYTVIISNLGDAIKELYNTIKTSPF